MIVCLSRKFILLHPPKTGGTSVTLALEGCLADGDVVLGDTPGAKHYPAPEGAVGNLWKHARLSEVAGLVGSIAPFRVILPVRNPWDRMVSFYAWAQAQRFSHPMVDAARRLTFSQFLHDPGVGQLIQSGPYGRYAHDRSGIERTTDILRFDRLDADLAALGKVLMLESVVLPHTNRSDRSPDYRGYYRDRDIARVGSLCAEDISRFGYTF